MNSIESLNWRYATKKFNNDKTVTEQFIKELEQVFRLVPTSYGLQPVRLTVVSSTDLKEQMVAACYGQQQVKDCSHVLVLSTISIDDTYIENYFKLVMELRNTPAEILAPFKKQLLSIFGKNSVAENDVWARNQAYIALGMLMNACAMEQIDSCPMEGFVPAQIDALLGLDKRGLKSCLLLPIGYRATDDMFATMAKVRLPLTDVVNALD